MNHYDVLLSGPAALDLSDMARYISVERMEPAAAQRLIGKIEAATLSLAELPTRHSLVTDGRLAALGVRMLPIEDYIMFYIVCEADETVTVLRVPHGRRDWEHLS